ncbi:MAG: insulinase family protein [Magnetococcus sp. WYHC-3]
MTAALCFRPRLSTLLAWCVTTLGILAWAVTGTAAALPPHRDFTLENGLRVVLVQNAKAPVVTTHVWYRVGGADEDPGLTGVAHMLEHMMFQGTDDTAPGEFSRRIAENGGQDNAATSLDYTMYHVKLSADRLPLALELEADRMVDLALRQEEFVQENKVVAEERRMRTDSSPAGRFGEAFRAMVYGEHPYGRPVIGHANHIRAITLDALSQWYRRYYAPNNAALVVVGAMDLDKTRTLVERYFAPLQSRPLVAGSPWTPAPVPDHTQVLLRRDARVTLASWTAAFHVPSLTHPRDGDMSYTLDLLVTLLGNGGSSRLYRRMVVEEGLAVSVGAGYNGLSRDGDLVTVSAVPREGVTLEQLQQVVFAELRRLAQTPPEAREVARAVNALEAGRVFAMDDIHSQAWEIGRLLSLGLDWTRAYDYPQHLRQVTPAMIQEAARRFLDPNRAFVGQLLPLRDSRAKVEKGS